MSKKRASRGRTCHGTKIKEVNETAVGKVNLINETDAGGGRSAQFEFHICIFSAGTES